MRRPQERRLVLSPRRILAVVLAMFGQQAAGARIVETFPTEDRLAERIGDGVVQFHANRVAKAGRLPSMSLESEVVVLGAMPDGFAVVPTFAKDKAGRFVTRVEIDPGTSLYGTGQAGGELRRNGKVTEAWNTDAYGYGAKTKALYTSHPWVLGVRADGSAFGVLADTTYRVEIDLRDAITFRAAGPAHPVIVIDGDHPAT
jgi:alpha-glucosidase